jgi:hypothetical protein
MENVAEIIEILGADRARQERVGRLRDAFIYVQTRIVI